MAEDVRTAQANGIKLAYRTWGEGTADGTPVVLLHCLGEDGEDWRGPLVSQLAAAHPLYAPDLRGHGSSDWPGAYGLDAVRDDLLGLLDELGLDRVILIGHAYGAAVASLFAAAHPERVERLVLEETAALVAPPTPSHVPEPPRGRPLFDWEAEAQYVRQRNDPDPRWWDGLESITAPTLLVGGGDTSPEPRDGLAAMAARIPHARLVVIEGGGHMVHEERPREFTTAVLTFLTEG
ncbi:alpha/beta hydrolase [Streptomyces sp. ODS28]|uniref:alpha/beta fold hydrolase n=1 Tax=Streptomyces sp. ODS28 TaxID=3136688 RepID=UPI0031EF001E